MLSVQFEPGQLKIRKSSLNINTQWLLYRQDGTVADEDTGQ